MSSKVTKRQVTNHGADKREVFLYSNGQIAPVTTGTDLSTSHTFIMRSKAIYASTNVVGTGLFKEIGRHYKSL